MHTTPDWQCDACKVQNAAMSRSTCQSGVGEDANLGHTPDHGHVTPAVACLLEVVIPPVAVDVLPHTLTRYLHPSADHLAAPERNESCIRVSLNDRSPDEHAGPAMVVATSQHRSGIPHCWEQHKTGLMNAHDAVG